MALTQKRTIQELFRKYCIRPSKKLGQNFLIDKKILEKIAKEARLEKNDIILEIGPGIGNLTQVLAQKAKMVIAVEKDPKMCRILKELLEDWKVRNVEIIQKDILKIFNSQFSWTPLDGLPEGLLFNKFPISNYKVVANLPFYLTAPVIRKFLESDSPPAEMVLVVQKEVAQRICAKPPNMSILAVSVQFYAKPEIISYISKKSFWPRPKVNAAILRIAPLTNTDKKQINTDLFFKIVKAGFAHPRKQLANNLSSGLKLDKPTQILPCKTWAGKEKIKSWLLKNKINPERRAETLSLKDWLILTKNFNFLFF